MNSNNFRPMYQTMGINLDKLGCIMLDLDGSIVPKIPDESVLYFTERPERFWIKGFVAGHTPHVTLLYGLMESGNTTYRPYIDEILKGWAMSEVEIDHVGYFESPYEDDPYYCIIAHIKITDQLLDGRSRLEFLPHINTFPGYKAHITIAYIKKDEAIRDEVINFYNNALSGKTLAVKSLNYGK